MAVFLSLQFRFPWSQNEQNPNLRFLISAHLALYGFKKRQLQHYLFLTWERCGWVGVGEGQTLCQTEDPAITLLESHWCFPSVSLSGSFLIIIQWHPGPEPLQKHFLPPVCKVETDLWVSANSTSKGSLVSGVALIWELMGFCEISDTSVRLVSLCFYFFPWDTCKLFFSLCSTVIM